METLKIADSFTDIYLPDLKFIDPLLSKRYTGREDYAKFALPAIEFMAKKPLKLDESGKMLSGCIVRHLIMPLAVYDSVKIIEFVSKLGEGVYFSLMSQFTPMGEAENFPELRRPITKREYAAALEAVRAYGLKNVFLQDRTSSDRAFVPDWDY